MFKASTESEAMEEIYINMGPVGKTASNHTGWSSSKERLCLRAAVCLGILNVLLLAELIALSVHTHDMTADFSDISNILTEQNSGSSKFPSMIANFTETAPRAEDTLREIVSYRTNKHQLFLFIQGLRKKRRADPLVMDDIIHQQ